jgi:hypothetical protein
MTDRLSWQRAFRQGQAPAVVQALCSGWNNLAQAISPDTFHATAKESHLTELLCEHLRATQRDTKLSGKWSYENRVAKLTRVSAQGLGAHQRKRTDIQFYSDRDTPALDLVFEFKKLGSPRKRRDDYSGAEGMLRFITGIYAEGQPVALMVGILLEHPDDCVPPLSRWLDSAEAKVLLHMESVGDRQRYLPSRLFPEHSAFDTEHLRPSALAPEHRTIVISHLFLGFPNGPAAGAKQKRRTALIEAMDQ